MEMPVTYIIEKGRTYHVDDFPKWAQVRLIEHPPFTSICLTGTLWAVKSDEDGKVYLANTHGYPVSVTLLW